MKTRSLFLLALCGLALQAQGHGPLHDPFGYSPGTPLIGQTLRPDYTWIGAGPAPGVQAMIDSASLQYPCMEYATNNRVLIRAGSGPSAVLPFSTPGNPTDDYGAISNGTIYFSFALRVLDTNGLGPAGNYFAGLWGGELAGATTPALIFTRVLLRTAPGGYQVGLSKSSGVAADFTWDPRTFNTNDTLLLVGAYVFQANVDVAYLWVNPDATNFCAATPPPATLTNSAGADAVQLASFVFMQRPLPLQPAALLADELHIGGAWLDVVAPGCDFSDLPDGPYQTMKARNGPRHQATVGFQLGLNVSVECDGQPDPLAALDTYDDGVTGLAGLHRGETRNITVTGGATGELDVYIDWNADGDFQDPGEYLYGASISVGGPIPVTVPMNAALGYTYALFRLSTGGNLPPVGYAANGEVESYRVQILPPLPPDLGVAPIGPADPVTHGSNFIYSITATNKGEGAATSTTLTVPLPAGFTFSSATASQGSCSNSASGVVCNLGTLQPGGSATVSVVGVPDFDLLATAGNIPDLQETIDVTNSVTVTSAETDALPADNSAAVVVAVVPLRDFGDAIVPPYPTLLPNGARHRVGALRFGTLLDAEPNGQPVDLDGGDEFPDGFGVLPGGFYAGGLTPIVIQVSGPAGYIDLWIDQDGILGWGAADHVLGPVAHPGGGIGVGYMVSLPAGAVVGPTWARARVHLNVAGLPPTGYGGYGEVTDFQVNIVPAAVDLVVSEPPAPVEVTEGDQLTQTITVSNKGPSTATGTILEVHFPPGATLDGLQLSQGTGQMEGTNVVVQLGTLAANASATVTFTAGTSNIFESIPDEFMDFCWGIWAVEPELNPADNMHHGLVRVWAKREFSDAPDSMVDPAYAYPTRFVDNGARHRPVGPYFAGSPAGATHRDPDPDGMPTLNADGDDLLDGNDDEEGIQILDAVYPGATGVRVSINAPLGGVLDAWIDFNRNGRWSMGAPEQIFASLPLAAGTFEYTFNVPAGAVLGSTYARFRISSMGGLAFTGYGINGEVHDEHLEIVPQPAPPDLRVVMAASPNPVIHGSNLTYSITVANGGAGVASGVAVSSGFMDAWWDFSWFQSVSVATSQGSCSNGASGIVCHLGTLQPGGTATITIVGVPDFDTLATVLNIPDTQESIETSNTVAVTSLEVDATPADNIAVAVIPILPQRDWGDAPDPTYPTLWPLGARHRIGPPGNPLRFGVLIDAEPNGLPVDLDDVIGVNDETPDGIAVGPIYPGGLAPLVFVVNGPPAVIDFWIDLDGLPGWGATDHILGPVAHPGGGAAVGYAPAVPVAAIPGLTWARARVHQNAAGLPPGGYGGIGEVVDFQVNILPMIVDLFIASAPESLEVTEGDPLTLSLTVSNKGPSTATGATLEVHFPPGATLEAFQTSQGTGQMEGTNLVVHLGTLAPNALATVTFTAGTSNIFESIPDEFMDFCWGILAVEPELNPDDNMHHGTVRVWAKRDFSDAPDATVGPAFNYPTRWIDNGARHRIVGPYFGGSPAGVLNRDPDPDGMPTLNADGDDLLDANDDEAGIQVLDAVYPGATGVRVRINAPLGGRLVAWIDFNRNGQWGLGAPEQIFFSLALTPGTFNYTFDVPAGAVVGPTYARFRVSSQSGLGFTGYVTNGEVQDLTLNIVPPPAPPDLVVVVAGPNSPVTHGSNFTFSISVSNAGAGLASGVNSFVDWGGWWWFRSISVTTSQGSCSNSGSDIVCNLGTLQPGATATINVTGIADFDQVATALNLPDTQESLTISNTVSVTLLEVDPTPADNLAVVVVPILPLRDWGDAITPPYPVLGPTGARHRIGPPGNPLRFGVLIDAEPNGQPVDQDDVIGLPDEVTDGFGLPAGGLPAGGWTPINIQVSGPPGTIGYIDLWIDLDGVPGWGAADHVVVAFAHPGGGAVVPVPVLIPPGALIGPTWARARVHLNPAGLPPDGPGGFGEVVDFQVNILPNPVAVFAGLEHVASSNATVTLGASGLRIGNLSSSNDIVRVNLGRAEGWRGEVASFENLSNLTFGVKGAIGGHSNQLLHSLRIERSGSNQTFAADFTGLGAGQYIAQVYDRSGVLLYTTAPMTPEQTIVVLGCVYRVEVFADSIYYAVCDCDVGIPGNGFPGGGPGGVLVKLSAVGATASPDYLSGVDISGMGGTAFTVANEAIKLGGFWHQFQGGATLSPGVSFGPEIDWPILLRVGNIGSSGQDGLLTELGGADALDVTLDPVDLKAAGGVFRVRADGQAGGSNGPLATLELTGNGNAAQMVLNVASIPFLLEFSAWNGAQQIVHQLPVNSGSAMTLTPESNGPVSLQYFGVFKDEQNRLVAELEFVQPVTVTPAGGSAVRASRVRYTSGGLVESLSSVVQNWSGFGALGLFFFGREYGDAPTGYPVLLAENGARHRWSPNWKLGANWDRDFIVSHSPNADWDDLHNSFGLPAAVDDEDGVVFLTTLGGILVQVTAAHDGYLNAWMDFNRDIDWGDAGEHIITDAVLAAGVPQNFSITVPAGTTAGQFFSRWRLSETPGLSYTGYGGKGEVEDHVCDWTPEGGGTNDFGDAPNNYMTYSASGGPSHVIVAGEYLGLTIDGEGDGQPVDLDGADEDGVALPAAFVPGAMVYITVTASVAGRLDAWIDFNHNGTFDTGAGSPEPVCVSVMLAPGPNPIPINVPPGATIGGTWARFRFSLAGGLAPGGPAPDGEVEDYGPNVVIIGNNPNQVDLVATATPSSVQVTEGDSFTITHTVRNRGPGTATSVRLNSTLPTGVTVTSVTNSAGTAQVQGSNVVCTVASLAPQQSFTVVVTSTAGLVPEDFAAEVYCDEVWWWEDVVSAAETDLNPTDNYLRIDYTVAVKRDLGDAPASTYPTLLPSGARHRVKAVGPRLGVNIDAEPNGQPVNRDDTTGVPDDEDGVVFGGPLVPGSAVNIIITASAPGQIDAWVDYDGTPGWSPAEQILVSVAHPGGGVAVTYPWTVPATAVPGGTWARFRISTAGGLGTTGFAPDGEVEDNPVFIRSPQPLAGPGVSLENGGLRLRWDKPDAILEEADEITGPWTPVPEAGSGHRVPPDRQRKFYRLRTPETEANFGAMLREADLVFEGVVTSVDYQNSSIDAQHRHSLPHTFVTLRSEQIIKGRLTGTNFTLRFVGGVTADGTKVFETSRSTLFDVGERSILFVRRNGETALPIVDSPAGRFRVINDQIVTEDGREVLWTKEGRVAFGRYLAPDEVVNNMIGNVSLRRARSPQVSEAPGATATGRPVTKAFFAALLNDTLPRVHTSSELASVPAMPSADPAQPFFIGNPAPALPPASFSRPVTPTVELPDGLRELLRWIANDYNPVLP